MKARRRTRRLVRSITAVRAAGKPNDDPISIPQQETPANEHRP